MAVRTICTSPNALLRGGKPNIFSVFATQTNICVYFELLTQIIFSAGAGNPRGGFLPRDRGPRISCDIKPQVGSLYSTRRCYVRWSSNLQCAILELRPAPAPTSQGWISFFDLRFKLMTSHTLTPHLLGGDGVPNERSTKWHVCCVETVMMVVLLSNNCNVVTQMKRCWKEQHRRPSRRAHTPVNTHTIWSAEEYCAFVLSSQKHDYI